MVIHPFVPLCEMFMTLIYVVVTDSRDITKDCDVMWIFIGSNKIYHYRRPPMQMQQYGMDTSFHLEHLPINVASLVV